MVQDGKNIVLSVLIGLAIGLAVVLWMGIIPPEGPIGTDVETPLTLDEHDYVTVTNAEYWSHSETVAVTIDADHATVVNTLIVHEAGEEYSRESHYVDGDPEEITIDVSGNPDDVVLCADECISLRGEGR